MIYLKSHGFKFSRPEANVVFDVSYFSNPWRDPEIRKLSSSESDGKKLKKMIEDYMAKQEGIAAFISSVIEVIEVYNYLYPDENVIVAFCCSAGEYRSPAIVEIVAKDLKRKRIEHQIIHSQFSKI